MKLPVKAASESAQKWSERSQRGLLRQYELQVKLGAAQRDVESRRKDIADLEQQREYWLKKTLEKGFAHAMGLYTQTVETLKAARAQLELYEVQHTFLKVEIDNLALSPAQAKHRAEQQEQLAGLAAERLEKDRQTDTAMQEFRRLLQERAQLTARMAECAADIDLPADLDAERFNNLRASLPEELAATSGQWIDWFLGRQKETKSYVVRDALLAIPETLASDGVHHCGDPVELTDEQAQELLQEDRPAQVAWDELKRNLPPSIVTVQSYEAAVAKAQEMGCSAQDVFGYEDLACMEHVETRRAAIMARNLDRVDRRLAS